jgi:hypothetical protein
MKVIHRKFLPTTVPTWKTITVFLLLDRLNWPGWAQGVVWTLVAISWIAAICVMCAEREAEPMLKDMP